MPTGNRNHHINYQSTHRKPKYDVIDTEKRIQLLRLVLEEKYSIYKASKLIGINNATAKVIVRKYRREGKIFIRKSQKKDQKHGFQQRQEVLQENEMNQQQIQIGGNYAYYDSPYMQLYHFSSPYYSLSPYYYLSL